MHLERSSPYPKTTPGIALAALIRISFFHRRAASRSSRRMVRATSSSLLSPKRFLRQAFPSKTAGPAAPRPSARPFVKARLETLVFSMGGCPLSPGPSFICSGAREAGLDRGWPETDARRSFAETPAEVGRPDGRRLRRDRLEPGLMRVVAAHADPVVLLAVPGARARAVDPHLPVAEDGPVALATQDVRALVVDQFTVGQPQPVALVAVEAPPLRLGVSQADARVRE